MLSTLNCMVLESLCAIDLTLFLELYNQYKGTDTRRGEVNIGANILDENKLIWSSYKQTNFLKSELRTTCMRRCRDTEVCMFCFCSSVTCHSNEVFEN